MSKPDQPTCPSCGYDITGVPLDELAKASCPECGKYTAPVQYATLRQQRRDRLNHEFKMFGYTLGVMPLLLATPAIIVLLIVLFAVIF